MRNRRPLNEDPELDDYSMERLNNLRFGIKKDRDMYFVNHRYGDLDSD